MVNNGFAGLSALHCNTPNAPDCCCYAAVHQVVEDVCRAGPFRELQAFLTFKLDTQVSVRVSVSLKGHGTPSHLSVKYSTLLDNYNAYKYY